MRYQWTNLAQFKQWANYIIDLAEKDPASPIPHSVVSLRPVQRPLTESEKNWVEHSISTMHEKD